MIATINHQGKEILYIDYRNLGDDEMIDTINQMREKVLALNKPHLRLVNVSGTNASARFRTQMRQIGKEIGHIPSKVAIVGVPTSKRVVINAYNVMIGGKMKLFDNEEDAKVYLVS
ncbi:hypothetical protein [Ekhidna sp.]